MLRKITPDDLPLVWPQASEWLSRAIERDGLITHESVLSGLKNGYNQLWMCETAAAVTSLEEYPNERICFVWLAGGSDLSKILNHVPDIEQWAKESGCSRVRVTGRKGWLRAMKDYTEPYVTVEKKI